MEPEGSTPHSQETATCPYPEADHSIQCPQSYFPKIHFNIILGLSFSGFPTKTL